MPVHKANLLSVTNEKSLIFQSCYRERSLEEEHNLPSYVEILCILVISYQTMEQ